MFRLLIDPKMKSIAKTFILLALAAVLLTYSSCDNTKPPTPTDQEVQLEKLTGTWKATSVKKDNVDQAGYGNFALTIEGVIGASSFGYSTSGRPSLSPWPSSGKWIFDVDPITSIVRDDGTVDELNMTYTVTETTLQVTFNFQGTGYAGRVDNVKGQWVMDFGL